MTKFLAIMAITTLAVLALAYAIGTQVSGMMLAILTF